MACWWEKREAEDVILVTDEDKARYKLSTNFMKEGRVCVVTCEIPRHSKLLMSRV
jgi:hypothetical protein